MYIAHHIPSHFWYKSHQMPKPNVYRLVLQVSLPHQLKPGVEVDNEDVVWAAPTGDAPTTSEWWTILLPTKVQLILDVWRYITVVQIYVYCYVRVNTLLSFAVFYVMLLSFFLVSMTIRGSKLTMNNMWYFPVNDDISNIECNLKRNTRRLLSFIYFLTQVVIIFFRNTNLYLLSLSILYTVKAQAFKSLLMEDYGPLIQHDRTIPRPLTWWRKESRNQQ